MLGDSMILSEPDDTHMTVFNSDKELMDLIREISSSEGLLSGKGKNGYESGYPGLCQRKL